MGEYFIGQVMIAGLNYAPRNLARCSGQIVPITQNVALFSLLGTQFGGNGSTTFALPDLRGRTPIGISASPAIPVGQSGGTESVVLQAANLPTHAHRVNASTAAGDNRVPVGRVHARGEHAGSPVNLYGPSTGTIRQADSSVGSAGGSQAHPNMQPYTVLNFCIALYGIYPSRP